MKRSHSMSVHLLAVASPVHSLQKHRDTIDAADGEMQVYLAAAVHPAGEAFQTAAAAATAFEDAAAAAGWVPGVDPGSGDASGGRLHSYIKHALNRYLHAKRLRCVPCLVALVCQDRFCMARLTAASSPAFTVLVRPSCCRPVLAAMLSITRDNMACLSSDDGSDDGYRMFLLLIMAG